MLFHSSYLVVPGHLGSAVTGQMGDVVATSGVSSADGSVTLNGDDAAAPPASCSGDAGVPDSEPSEVEGTGTVSRSIGGIDPQLGYPTEIVAWSLGSSRGVGMALSLNAQSSVKVSLDGVTTQEILLPNHVLNLDDLNAPLAGRPIEAAEELCFWLRYTSEPILSLIVEIKNAAATFDDVGSEPRIGRSLNLSAKSGWQQQCVSLAAAPGDDQTFDRTAAKEIVLLVSRDGQCDGGQCAKSGHLELEEVFFKGGGIVSRDQLLQMSDDEFLEHLAFKAAVQVVRLASLEPSVKGLAQDRYPFGDLFSTGSEAFLLASLPAIVDHGWLARDTAARIAREGLEFLAGCPDSATSPDKLVFGACKDHGLLYHFLGSDGLRKRNYGDAASNTVEASVIDEGLLLVGAHTAETYFDGETDDELALRTAASSLRAQIDWRRLYSFTKGQMCLDWRPTEGTIVPGPSGTWSDNIPDSCVAPPPGYLSGRPGQQASSSAAATIDYPTDESICLNSMALAAPDDHRPPSLVWRNWLECTAAACLSSSGAMFVYQFASLLGLDTMQMEVVPGLSAYDNACRVHESAIKALGTQLTLPAAHETPFQRYHVNASAETLAAGILAQRTALGQPPIHDGGIAPYAWAAAFVCRSDLVRTQALSALRQMVKTLPVYNPLTGLADVYYPDVATALAADPQALDGIRCARTNGPWTNHTAFGIDQGPIFLGLEKELCRRQKGQECPARLTDSPLLATAIANGQRCASSGWIEGEWGHLTNNSGSCGRTEWPFSARCDPLVCEPGLAADQKDNFPDRPLTGGQAVTIFRSGTILTFDGVGVAGAPTLDLEYSIDWPDTSGVSLRACLDHVDAVSCVTLEGVQPTSDWDHTNSLSAALPVIGDGSCQEHQLLIVADALPQPWGFQIDRLRLTSSP